jgi:S-DNA-T family DNA segregation ATPase FtsK/SpoIIIE
MTQKKLVSTNNKDKKATRSTTGRTTATRRRPAASRRSAKGFLGLPLRGRSRPLLTEISPERKLDLFGVTLALLGLLTLLSLISTQRSAIPAWWIGVLQQAFGWGAAILPLILIVIGLWMVLRNLEPLPQLSIERLVGIGLLFFVVLSLISLFAGEDLATSTDLNGGVVGAWMASTLTGLTGIVGAGIILTAGFLVGLALTLDVSIPEMFRWVRPLVERIQAAWEQYQTERRQRVAETQSRVAIQDELPDGFSPLPGAEAWTDAGDDAGQALPTETPSALVPTRIGEIGRAHV